MRIDRLDLIAYGPFAEKSLDLSAGESGLHLIYGDNEAGKSTSLRALIAWLFGIPKSSRDNYVFSYPQLRIGGKLRLADGRSIEFTRRKGTKNTLMDSNGDAPLDDSVLLPFLPQGIDEQLFTKLYGIDHVRLVAGGQELLNQSGDLGQALFSAAVGTESLREILSELGKSADNLFKPRARTAFVNQAIAGFKEAKKEVKASSLPVAQWKRLQKDLADKLAEIQQVDAEIHRQSKEKSRLDRLKRVRGPLAERRAVMAQIEAMGDVLLLPEDFEAQYKAAVGSLQRAGNDKVRLEAKLSRLKEASAVLHTRNELLDNEEVILALYKELGAVETAAKDRPQQDGKRRQLRNEAERQLLSIRPDFSLDNADNLRPLLSRKEWLIDLSQRHGLLNQKKESAEAARRNIEEQQTGIAKELSGISPSGFDLNAVKAAVSAARKAGNIEQRLMESQKRASKRKASCERELSRLGRFTGTLDTLLNLSMPVSETLDMFERRFDEIHGRIREISQKKKNFEAERKQAEQTLDALLSKSDVPTISQLEAARKTRNTGWNLVKRKYIENRDIDIAIEKQIAAFTPDIDLPVFYEQKVEQADHLSDLLRTSADKVAKRADLEARIHNLTSRCGELAAQLEASAEEKNRCEDQWSAIWTPMGVVPGAPREMKQWLLNVNTLLSNVGAMSDACGEAEKIEAEFKNIKHSISLQIVKFDPSIDLQDMRLEAMIDLCEQRIEKERALLLRRRELEKSLENTKIQINRIWEDLKSIEIDLANWRREWKQAIDGLGLTPDAHPKQAVTAYNQLALFFDRFDKSEDLRKRIYGIDLVEKKFNAKVFEFADKIKFEKEGQAATTIAARMNRELADAREARVRLVEIKTRENDLQAEIEDAKITIRTARDQLAALRRRAGVETDDKLEAAARESQKKRRLQQMQDGLEQELTRNGDGLSIRELEQEAAASDVDAIEGDLESVGSELAALQTKRDALRDERQTLYHEIKAMDGGSTAAKKSEEAEQQLAAVVYGAEKYLRLKIAALILEQQIEDYRRKNQAPVLARAGRLFSRLTLNSYANLRDELDDSKTPVLLGVRPNNDEVPMDGMSDGTRDQLYLALRLATLEQHLKKGEPMPFIVDDILIGFDDNRTRVCLEVLSELAQSTQVLLFTHHKRVLELADGIGAKAGIYQHRLN